MKKKTRKKVVRRKRRSMALSEYQRKLLPLYLRGNRGLTPRQRKMLDFLKRVYPQYSELAKDSATKKDASRLARLKLIKVRSFKRTGTSRGKRFSMMIMEARAMAPKGGQLSSPYLGLARNPARTNKAHFGYAKNGMELLGTGLKIKKGERVYMTPATNIPGGGFFVEPAYRTGLWKQGSGVSILIKPKDFDDEITYVEPRGEYRPTPQVKPDYKYGIYTGRGIARNPMRSFASLHPSDRAKLKSFFDYVYSYYGKGGLYARDFKNGGFDRKTIERAIMVYIADVRKGKAEWGGGDTIDRERVRTILQPSYSMFIPEGKMTIRSNSRRGLRKNGVMADAENEFLMKYGLTPDQARSKFFAMIGSSFEKAQKLSFEEKVKIRDAYEVFKKKLLKAKMSMRRR